MPIYLYAVVKEIKKIMNTRPSWDQYFLNLLNGVKLRASCPRRQCGAIIVSSSYELISTGYNGPPSRLQNCTEFLCGAENDSPGETSNCIALHAEHNAIYFAKDKILQANILYCTNAPCMKCALEILQTPIKKVIFLEDYADHRGKILLNKGNIQWQQVDLMSTTS